MSWAASSSPAEETGSSLGDFFGTAGEGVEAGHSDRDGVAKAVAFLAPGGLATDVRETVWRPITMPASNATTATPVGKANRFTNKLNHKMRICSNEHLLDNLHRALRQRL